MRKTRKLLSILLCVILLAGMLSITASAASYPLVYATMESDTVLEGETAIITLNIIPEYHNEEYHLYIYDSNGDYVASAENTYYNSDGTYTKKVNISINTAKLGMEPGRYKAVYWLSFYSLYSWHDAPNKYQYYFTVIEDICHGNHNMQVVTVLSQGTCETQGRYEMVCSNCGYSYEDTFYEDHSYSAWTKVDNDTHKHTCEVCQTTETNSHNWDNGIILKQPTQRKEGEIKYTCTDCGYAKTEKIAKLTDGWCADNGKWYFYENSKMVKNTWRKDSIGWCYLGSDGAMITNQWLQDSDGPCYVGPDGYCVTGSYTIDGVEYVFDSEGNYIGEAGSTATMTEGWNLVDGKWYFVENGVKVTNQWRRDSIGWCLLGDDGAMLTNQWTTDSDGWCYIGPDGYCVTGTYYVDGAYHNFDSEGNWLGESSGSSSSGMAEGWNLVDGKWYFVENGVKVTNQWRRDSIGWCLLGDDGAMYTNTWLQDSVGWCYIGAEGYCLVGTQVIDGVTYTFNSEGQLIS